MIYDEIIVEIKNDYEYLYEYIEKNVYKYSIQQYTEILESLLSSIYENISIENNDFFTWEMIFEDFIRRLKKSKIDRKNEIIELFSSYDKIPMKDFYSLFLRSITYEKKLNEKEFAFLFEFLYLSMLCNCTNGEIDKINNDFINLIS